MTQPTSPAVWIDGDPLMEAIAAAVWERCNTEPTSSVVDDPRNIAAVAATVARQILGTTTEAASAPSVADTQPETEWVVETLWRNGEWRRHWPARATRYEAEQDRERSVHQDRSRQYRIVRVTTTTTVEQTAPAVTEEPGR
ncbi:hypothetical protein PUR34_41485 [Streptomyces sp. JV185]|uniref:hypothetical protein n=1 Tax=Streptomyces sp. JV185 TaxID=858638 RepID=UPI002E78160D|nr:hypothetical protein [Streptomyces sp. JV185]MEE1774478.1 hypothetical protein [Streptomyces sp. JV185]